jgi:hypothetical protein
MADELKDQCEWNFLDSHRGPTYPKEACAASCMLLLLGILLEAVWCTSAISHLISVETVEGLLGASGLRRARSIVVLLHRLDPIVEVHIGTSVV